MKAAVVENRVNQVDSESREIIELAQAAGYEVAVHLEVDLDPPHPRQYLPEMKVETLKVMMGDHEIDKVIFSQSLRPHQALKLEEILEHDILDKPMLILEIFEKKANSIDIKLQIQLAQLKYNLPRMVNRASEEVESEHAGFGAGGEQITDVIASDTRGRIKTIEAKIKQHKLQAANRQREDVPRFPIVGYYSAGKSTLFNILTDSDRETGAEAFTTMIMKTQRSMIAGYPVDLVDTVGLVDLPSNILSAFELMLTSIFSFSGMLLCLNTGLPLKQWKKQLAEFQDYAEQFTGDNPPRVIVALTKTDLVNPDKLQQMRTHLETQAWLSEMRIIETRADRREEVQREFVNAFEELFDDYLTHFYYQHISPSTASKIHNVARVDQQDWHNDGTTSMSGVGPTKLLDELKGEIFA